MENMPLTPGQGVEQVRTGGTAEEMAGAQLQTVEAGSHKLMGIVWTLISAAAFGFMAIFTKFAYAADINLLTLLSLRFLIAAMIMWLVVLITRQNPRLQSKQLLALLVLGAVGYGLMSTFFFGAVKLIPASITAILLYTYPIIVTALAALIDKEPITRYRAASLVIGTIGLIMVVGEAFGGLNLSGIILGEMAAIVYSFYIFFSNRLLKGLNPVIVSTYIMTSAAVAFNIVGWSAGVVNLDMNLTGWFSLAGIAVVSTVIAILTFFQGMKVLGPSKVSIVSTIEPVVTTVAAFILFGEMLSGLQALGGFLVIGAVLLVKKE